MDIIRRVTKGRATRLNKREPLPRAKKEKVEYDFRNYKKWKSRAKQINNELTYITVSGSKIDGEIRERLGISDPTGVKVLNRDKLRREYDELMRKINAVENAFDAMNEKERKIVSCRYFEGYFARQCMARLDMEKTEFYRLLNNALAIYADVCVEMTEFG